MKVTAQLLDGRDGTRTPVLTRERSDLANMLLKDYVNPVLKLDDPGFLDKVYVLVLTEGDDDAVKFSFAPLLTVQRFCELYATQHAMENV